MLTALFLLSACACTGGSRGPNAPPAEDPYDLLGIGNIHFGMWVTPPASARTQEAYDTLAESGINFVNGFEFYESDESGIRQALTFAGEAGLKFLVADRNISTLISTYETTQDPTLIEQAMQTIESYYDYPAYAGQLLLDEPNRRRFDTVKTFIDAYEMNYPGKQWHVNMFPEYAEGGAGVPYEQYVDEWLDLVDPNYYSYDSYPLLVPDPDNPFTRYEDEGYYHNLDLLRAKTSARRIPLWSFIQTLAISGTPGVANKREPSREDIRWQVFTNLAFGVKGMQYFCYWTPESGAETFGPALIDRNGEKTPRYTAVQEVNREVLSYGNELIRCDSKGVILHAANPSQARYRLYEDSLTSFGPVTEVTGDDALIGCFYDPYTKKYSVLVVPTTPRDAVSVTLKIRGANSAAVTQAGEKQTVGVAHGEIALEIDAGDSAYLVF